MKNYMSIISETAEKLFGINAIKPFQILVMHRILEQDDYYDINQIKNQIVILPTGTGKSLCFLLPAVLCSGITVIVYPLLALMNDQISKLKANNIKCCCLKGGQTKAQRNAVFSNLSNGVKILITNPETLTQNKILKRISNYKISLFVCDEAHVVSLWGKTFRPSYLNLKICVETLKPKQILSFTATASEKIINDIKNYLYINSEPLIIKGDMDRENIFYQVHQTINKDLGVLSLIKICKKPAIVFCKTRLSAMKQCISGLRHYPEIQQKYYHAGLNNNIRTKIENWFLNNNDGILYATCAYGMGVDKKNIKSVIHYDLPDTVEEYLQESGRAGRDGDAAKAYVVIEEHEKPKTLLENVFFNNSCRRYELLNNLGQEKNECTGCDVCWNSRISKSMELSLIEKIIKKYPLRFNSSYIGNILTGSADKKIISHTERFNQYYGNLKNYDSDLIQIGIEKLVINKNDKYGTVDFLKSKNLIYNKNKIFQKLFSKIISFINSICILK